MYCRFFKNSTHPDGRTGMSPLIFQYRKVVGGSAYLDLTHRSNIEFNLNLRRNLQNVLLQSMYSSESLWRFAVLRLRTICGGWPARWLLWKVANKFRFEWAFSKYIKTHQRRMLCSKRLFCSIVYLDLRGNIPECYAPIATPLMPEVGTQKLLPGNFLFRPTPTRSRDPQRPRSWKSAKFGQ